MSKVKKFVVKVNGRDYEVEVEEVTTEKSDKIRRPVPAVLTAPRSKPHQTLANGKITAPMPGVVTAVKVKVGDEVEPEQSVLTLEAMKMENEIPAGKKGVVREVHVQSGQSVAAGELLVVIE